MILSFFFFILAMMPDTRDLSSLTRDQTCAPCKGPNHQIPNHWTTREVPISLQFNKAPESHEQESKIWFLLDTSLPLPFPTRTERSFILASLAGQLHFAFSSPSLPDFFFSCRFLKIATHWHSGNERKIYFFKHLVTTIGYWFYVVSISWGIYLIFLTSL